jgi:hypothetical protein
MGDWIDGIARMVAQGVSRRTALRYLAGGLATVGLASVALPEPAAAKKSPRQVVCGQLCKDVEGKKAKRACKKECRTKGGACVDATCQEGDPADSCGETCFCTTTPEGVKVCVELDSCDTPACTKSKDCPDGSICSLVTCCNAPGDTQGVCIRRCGTGPFPTPPGAQGSGGRSNSVR